MPDIVHDLLKCEGGPDPQLARRAAHEIELLRGVLSTIASQKLQHDGQPDKGDWMAILASAAVRVTL